MISMAEYFSLCFGKDVILKHNGNTKYVDYVHECYKIEDYPKDGGYSGALILEANEGRKHGKNNKQYVNIYINALSDMPKAYGYIK